MDTVVTIWILKATNLFIIDIVIWVVVFDPKFSWRPPNLKNTRTVELTILLSIQKAILYYLPYAF